MSRSIKVNSDINIGQAEIQQCQWWGGQLKIGFTEMYIVPAVHSLDWLLQAGWVSALESRKLVHTVKL